MSLLTSLFRLIPPSFKAGYCPKTIQQLANDVINGTQLTFLIQSGNFIYNYGGSTPTADNRIFPWLNTNDGRWYTFQFGLWVSPRPFSFGQIWFTKGATESALWSMDGGDGTDPRATLPDGSANPAYVPPTSITGAMWMVEHSMDGRFPIGAGTIPNAVIYNTTTAITVAPGGTSDSNGVPGSYDEVLSIQQIPWHGHGLPQSTTKADPGTTAGAWENIPIFENGSAWRPPSDNKDHGVAQFVWEGGDPNNSNKTVPHNKFPTFLGIYFVVMTSRQYYTIPA